MLMKAIIIFPKEFCEFTAQYAICYSLILPPADERNIRLMEMAAMGSLNFYYLQNCQARGHYLISK